MPFRTLTDPTQSLPQSTGGFRPLQLPQSIETQEIPQSSVSTNINPTFKASMGTGMGSVIGNSARTIGNIPSSALNIADQTLVKPLENIGESSRIARDIYQSRGFTQGTKDILGGIAETTASIFKAPGELAFKNTDSQKVIEAQNRLASQQKQLTDMIYQAKKTGKDTTKLTEALAHNIADEKDLVSLVGNKESRNNSRLDTQINIAKFPIENPVDVALAASGGESKIVSKIAVPFDSAADTVIDLTKSASNQVRQATQKVFNNTPEQIVSKRLDELNKIDSTYSSMRKASGFSSDEGVASRKRVASTDVLVGATDENGLIRTKETGGAVDQYKALTLDKAENVVRKNLERLGEKVNVEDVQTYLNHVINESGIEAGDLKVALGKVKREVAGLKLRADENGDIPLVKIHDAKISTTKGINYLTPPEQAIYRKTVAKGLKEIIEKNSSFNVREVNGEISKYLEDIEFLERLDGKRVKGGKLGKYFAKAAGQVIGGMAGGMIGGAPGSIAGGIVGGEIAGGIKGSILEKTLGGKAGVATPKNPILQKAITTGNSTRLALPAPAEGAPRSQINGAQINLPSKAGADYSYNLGNRNAIYKNTPITNKNVSIDQKIKTIVSNKTAPATKTSIRAISDTIPDKKGIVKRAVEAYKKSPLSDQGGYIAFGKGKNIQVKVSKYAMDRIHPEDIQYIVNNIARLNKGKALSALEDDRWEEFIKKSGIDKTSSAKSQVKQLMVILDGETDIPQFLQKQNRDDIGRYKKR